MKLTGTYNGKPVELELTEEQVKILEQEDKKKTGWERAEKYGVYYFHNAYDKCACITELGCEFGDKLFNWGNYFSNENLAKNIIRAQTLQRKLWRRSAELCEKINWKDSTTQKYSICYNYNIDSLCTSCTLFYRGLGDVCFDTEEHAKQVMEEFKDELIWYFTEFKSRMD